MGLPSCQPDHNDLQCFPSHALSRNRMIVSADFIQVRPQNVVRRRTIKSWCGGWDSNPRSAALRASTQLIFRQFIAPTNYLSVASEESSGHNFKHARLYE